MLRWFYAPHQYRYLYWALFVFGICFTTHQSLIVAGIGVQVAIAAANQRLGRDVFFFVRTKSNYSHIALSFIGRT